MRVRPTIFLSGRAALYAAILQGRANRPGEPRRMANEPQLGEDAPPYLPIARRELESVVSGLRRAGTTHHIPRGLLSRAWQRSLSVSTSSGQAASDSAQSDLDEAWEIAARGPMPLFLADILLYRARLFFREKPYPCPDTSARADLAEARRLIEKHGYGRRLEELADAEAAIK